MATYTPIYEATLQAIGQDVDAKGVTFSNQEGLPKLPLPEMDATFAALKSSLLPLDSCTPEGLQQYDTLAAEAMEQLRSAQDFLKAKHASTENYLIPWWEDYAYLSQRDPIPCSTNVFGIREQDFDRKTGKPRAYLDSCLSRAPLIMLETMAFNRMLAQQALPPEVTGRNKTPICMDQYRKYISFRKPGLTMDEIITTPAEESDCIQVLHRGGQFLVKVFRDKTLFGKDAASNSALNYAELRACLEEGIRQLEERKAYPEQLSECLGALTAGNRTNWAQAWAELEAASPQNKSNLEKIIRCMTALALDTETEVESLKECAEYVMFRNPYNRWFDRNSTKVVTKKGVVFDNGDHTPMDAVVLAFIPFEVIPRATKHCWESGAFEGEDHQKCRPGFNPKNFVEVLEWVIPESVKSRVESALKDHETVCGPAGVALPGTPEAKTAKVYSQVDVFKFKGYGRGVLRDMKINADALVQQVLQLAFYLDRGRCVPGYETAATRGFKLGRTDTIRPFTEEQKAFVTAITKEGVSTSSRARLRGLLMAAIKTHLQVSARASAGQGTDRHIFSLKIAQNMLISQDPQKVMPQVFDPKKCPLVSEAGSYTLLTSQMPGTVFVGGFGHVWADGYGCCYYLRKNEIAIMVSGHSKAGLTDLDRFQGNLTKAFSMVGELLCIENGKAPQSSSSKL